MKKLLFILSFYCMFSCSDDSDNDIIQDYTSFIIENKTNRAFKNVVTGYANPKDYYTSKLIGEHGTILPNSKTPEFILDVFIEEPIKIYFEGVEYKCILSASFNLLQNRKNIFVITSDTDSAYLTKEGYWPKR